MATGAVDTTGLVTTGTRVVAAGCVASGSSGTVMKIPPGGDFWPPFPPPPMLPFPGAGVGAGVTTGFVAAALVATGWVATG